MRQRPSLRRHVTTLLMMTLLVSLLPLPTAHAADTCDLSDIVVEGHSLHPQFAPGTTAYTVVVPRTEADTNVTFTVASESATLAVDGQPADSGAPTAVSLDGDTTAVTAVVTLSVPEGEAQSKTYTVTIIRPELTVQATPDIDVALAVGSTQLATSHFADDLKSKLSAAPYNIDPDRINISTIKASNVDARNDLGWTIYDHYDNAAHDVSTPDLWPENRPYFYYKEKYTQYSAPGVRSSAFYDDLSDPQALTGCYYRSQHIYAVNQDITFLGYSEPGFKDFMIHPDTTPGKKVIEFSIEEGKIDTHTLEGAGFLFNAGISGGNLSGYLVFYDYRSSKIELYQLTNVPADTFHNGPGLANINGGYPSITPAAGFAPIAFAFNPAQKTVRNIRIEATPTSVSLSEGGNVLFDVAIADTGVYGFGPLVGYYPHGCEQLTYFNFRNVTMLTERPRSFLEVMREPTWRDSARKFIVNLDDDGVEDFEVPHSLSEILYRTLSDNIHYIGWGRDNAVPSAAELNHDQAEEFIEGNDDHGMFVEQLEGDAASTAYAKGIAAIADYIAEQMPAPQVCDGNATPSVLVGDQVAFTVDPEIPGADVVIDGDPLDNPATLSHAGEHSLGLAYGSETIDLSDIAVQRPPVAQIDFAPDGTLSAPTGDDIAESKWTWRPVDGDWFGPQDTPPAQEDLPEGDCIVQLQVKDSAGVWSEPATRYISSDEDALPVASFHLSTDSLDVISGQKTVRVTNDAFHPNGQPLTTYLWSISSAAGPSGITPAATARNPILDFSHEPSGVYSVALTVRQDPEGGTGTPSATFTQTVAVTNDTISPTMTIGALPPQGAWTQSNTFTLTIEDDGGSGVAGYHMGTRRNPGDEITWGPLVDCSDVPTTVTIPDGDWASVTVRAEDGKGNTADQLLGSFKIDSGAPTVVFAPSGSAATQEGATTVTASDTGSGLATVEYQWTDASDFPVGGSWAELPEGGQVTCPNTDGVWYLHVHAIDMTNRTTDASSDAFVIDNTPPASENAVFSESALVQIGGSLTIVPTGDATDSIWLAPSGTTVFAEGPMMTKVAGNATAIAVPSAPGQYRIYVVDAAGNISTPSDATVTVRRAADSEPAEPTIALTVNGSDAGAVARISTNTEADGGQVSVVTFDEAALVSQTVTRNSTVEVAVPSQSGSGTVVARLSAQALSDLAGTDTVMKVSTAAGSYSLPAKQVDVAQVSQELGADVELSDVSVDVTVGSLPAAEVQVIESGLADQTMTLIAPPVEFKVECAYRGKTVDITRFSGYVERSIPIPDGVPAEKITTAVVVNKDGSESHVPTKITIIDGRYYAQINSLTNSVYCLIWNPVEFSDVAQHWSKEDVNDMGSRLVAFGVGDGKFAPDLDVSRAEFAALVERALGLKARDLGAPSEFSDVSESDWFFAGVTGASQWGIIDGYDDGTFRPANAVTRQEAMAMIARGLALAGVNGNMNADQASAILAQFSDSANVADWAADSVAECVQEQVVVGAGGRLTPADHLTRAEAAALVRRLLKQAGLI